MSASPIALSAPTTVLFLQTLGHVRHVLPFGVGTRVPSAQISAWLILSPPASLGSELILSIRILLSFAACLAAPQHSLSPGSAFSFLYNIDQFLTYSATCFFYYVHCLLSIRM